MALPGLMMPLGFMGGKVAFSEVSFFDSATNGSGASVSVPAGTKAGDLLVYGGSYIHESAPDPPSGFSVLHQAFIFAPAYLQISAKVADGSETSVAIPTGFAAGKGILAVFRGNGPMSSLSQVAKVTGTVTDGNPSAINVLAGSRTPPLVVFGYYQTLNGVINPRTMSPAKDGEVLSSSADGYHFGLAWKIYNTSPANVSVDMDDEGSSNGVAGWVLELS